MVFNLWLKKGLYICLYLYKNEELDGGGCDGGTQEVVEKV